MDTEERGQAEFKWWERVPYKERKAQPLSFLPWKIKYLEKEHHVCPLHL